MQCRYSFMFLISFYAHAFDSYTEIVPGVLYKNIILSNPAQSVHVIIADPLKVHIKIGIANDTCASAAKTTEIAKKNNALVAISGGFFDFGCRTRFQDMTIKILDCLGYSKYKAYPMYTLRNDNNYYSISHIFTGAIGWNNNDQLPSFDIIKTHIELTINGNKCLVGELNKPHSNTPTLFSACYGEKTLSFHKKVDEIIIEDNFIKKICKASRGRTKIPKNGWIYVLPEGYRELTASFKEGDHILISMVHDQQTDIVSRMTSENWHSMDYILASTPLLILNKQVLAPLREFTADFYTKKHPRSAIGVLQDGSWVFVVIDGRQKHSEGFTILELAEFMQELGCTGALNLDGGGSSTLVVQDKIVNSPSGREYSLFRKERPISNAILICKRIG